MQYSVFNLHFQIAIYHQFMSNNCNNDVLYRDTPGAVLEEEQPYISQFPPDIIN